MSSKDLVLKIKTNLNYEVGVETIKLNIFFQVHEEYKINKIFFYCIFNAKHPIMTDVKSSTSDCAKRNDLYFCQSEHNFRQFVY